MSRIRILTAALALTAAPAAFAGETCPSDALKVTGTAEAPFACTCAPNVSTSGWVYGTDRYTADSSICTSAVHAGVIQAAPGGDVKIYTGEGCGSFVSTTKNGITSASWGSYGATFAFVTPLPACATAAAATPAPTPAATPAAGGTPSATPPAGAAADGPAAWQARGDKYAAVLPDPLPGWEATTAEGFWENSAMTQRIVEGHRTYKKGGGMQSDVFVAIFNNPDGTPHERTEALWNDEAARTADGCTMGEAAGRKAMTCDRSGDIRVVFRMESGLFASVSILGSHDTTREDIDAYVAKLDFAAIEKLPMQ